MYKVGLYKPHMVSEVAKLMLPLYGSRLEPYLTWRYHDNPYTDKPLSMVVKHGKQIVGFRGYLATPWAIDHNLLFVMCVGDTIVHEKHRMKGLSIKMGQAAFEEFKDYDIFINTSAGNNVVPGYKKLGFFPLVEKKPYCLTYDASVSPHFEEDFENIYESTSLKAKRIENSGDNRISVVRDKSYFNWRFSSPRQRYHFYYHKVGDTITDYVAVSVRGAPIGHVVDFTNNDPEKLEEIIRYIVACHRYERIYINSETTDLPLEAMGFIFSESRHTNPILVKAHDWIVKDVDIRETKNWNLSTTYTDDM